MFYPWMRIFMAWMRLAMERVLFKPNLFSRAILLQLEATASEGVVRLLSDNIRQTSLVDAENTIDVTITRAGAFFDPRYDKSIMIQKETNSNVNHY